MRLQDHFQVDSEKTANSGSVKSATRVLDLFEFLGRWDTERTHTEIADELGIPKSSLTQLLKTLVRRGYLNYVPASKGYTLGPAIAALAKRSHEGQDLISAAQSILPGVVAEAHETCSLNILKGDKSEVVAAAMSPQRLHYTMRIGDTAPLYATSGGKALLAYLPADMVQEYFARVHFEQITPNTINSVTRLKEELEQVRAKGVAFVYEEFTPGIVGMARPILSASGYPLASINIAMPITRYNDKTRDLCLAALERAVIAIRQQCQLK